MNPREKILVICISTLFGIFVIYGAVHSLVLAPASAKARQIEDVRKKNAELDQTNQRLEKSVAEYVNLRERTFESNPHKASVLVNARIIELAGQAGIGADEITTNAFAGRVLPNCYREVGCNITASGSLEKMTSFLYLLARDKYLHRLTNLAVTPKSGSRDVSFTLRYSTLVLEELNAKPVATRATTRPFDPPRLTDPQRAVYDVIAQRNIFMPYVPMLAAAEAPPSRGTPPGSVSPPAPTVDPPTPRAWYDSLHVTGLPSNGEVAEVFMSSGGQTKKVVHRVGDDLPVGGKIAMVDYRPMAMPGQPAWAAKSPSRVILKIGQDYWGVELGQPLGERRVLKPDDLPEGLKVESAREKAATRAADKP